MSDLSASSEAPTPRLFDASPFESVPAFAGVEPGENQRWTTWPAITPSERGPQPWPSWVVTSAGALDTELGILKTGKEADVFLLERAVPDDPGRRTLLAAKRYRDSDHSSFHRSGVYTEGRSTRNTRDTRALAKKSEHGRAVAALQWSFAEFDALCRMWALGAPVPYPVQVNGTELLMEFIGDADGVAAPRLAAVRSTPHELSGLYDQVVDLMRIFAAAGFAHGDLSAYNLLVHRGRVRVIDLPQIVDIIANPRGLDLLHRDCVNICDWFTRRRVERDAEELFAEMLAVSYV
ncbi:serine/threonine protein kinase [Microbacterium foliorum]|uniref:non-specific serine/threonine protein kinase n=1 Tax=Microbacterium foliorum TaxID=104336 RepID=A0A0F0KW18_9MICO|nr:RIO1 family regulatory kinase/ATPase [Microbacterium foliorum]AXL13939.1 serine/threonine protein kinase [Microbacterium foliorum]KJL25112.1 RIO1 family protein [Microbacterium foliorum]